MIIETSTNQLFKVREAGPGLDHCWLGVAVKRARDVYVAKANASEVLVRRAGSKIVEAA